jgi:iron complex outermembrane recepter protein
MYFTCLNYWRLRSIGLPPLLPGNTIWVLLFIVLIDTCPVLAGNLGYEQPETITGLVVDGSTGLPLAFVTVTLSGSSRATQTDINGRFALNIDGYDGAEVVFTMVGYKTERFILRNPVDPSTFERIELSRSIQRFDDIIITGSPTGSGVHFQSVQAFNGDDLLKRRDVTVGHMLDGEPGVAMRSFGPAPSRPVIRGLDGERILILENGERMGDLSESAADHAVALDPGALSRIEIVRGPASLLYGNSAMGGVINLITRDIPYDWSPGYWGTLSATGATVNTFGMSSAILGYGSDRYALTARGSVRGAGNLSTPAGTISGTGLSTMEGSIGSGFRTDRLQGGVAVMGMHSSYGIPGDPSELGRVEIRFQRMAMQYRLEGRGDGFFDRFQVNGHASVFDQQEADIQVSGSGEWEEIPLTYQQRAFSTTLYLQHRPLVITDRGVVGVNVNGRIMDVGGSDAYTPGDQYMNVAVFTYQEVPLSQRVRLQAGLRLDTRSIAPRYQESAVERRTGAMNTDLAGSVGLNVRPSSAMELGIQFAKAHRYPTIEELYSDGVHLGAGSYERGSPELGTESGYGLDLYLRAAQGDWNMEIAGYSMWIQNFIRFESTGEVHELSGFPVFAYRSGAARLWGAEIQVEGQLGTAWTLRMNGDLVMGDVVGKEGQPLPQIPPVRFKSMVRYHGHGWWSQVQVQRVWSQNRVAPAESSTDGYALLGGSVGLQLGERRLHRVMLRIDNALNTSYQDHLSRVENRQQLMAGRNVSLTYTFDF